MIVQDVRPEADAMPTNRRYRTRVHREPIDPTQWALLTDSELPADANKFILLDRNNDRVMRPLWEEYGAAILANWIEEHPGTRPYLWWRYDAPRAKGQDKLPINQRQVEPRQVIFGEGQPLHEAFNIAPFYRYGIPDWCGNPDEPPIFEFQHDYLKRHGLLEKGEKTPKVDPCPRPARIQRA